MPFAASRPANPASKPLHELAVVPEEARAVIARLEGAPQLVVKLLYGSGLRLLEALRRRVHPVRLRNMATYCYVYVLRSGADSHFYVGLTRDLRARLRAHNNGQVPSTKRRTPLELVYWEGCLNQSDAAQREKYLKSAWGKRYIKGRLRRYLTG